MRAQAFSRLLIAALSLALLGRPAAAQDWNPLNAFLGPEHKEERKPPPQEPAPQFLDEKSFSVERTELAPVMATDGSGLPFELWRGLDVATLEKLIAELDIPPRSPALHGLWLRLITSDVTPPTGGEQDQHFMALRLETLYRSGLLEDASRELAKLPAGNALVAMLAARNEIGQGKKIEGCATAHSGGPPDATFPKQLEGQAALISGYCAILAGDAAGAGLAADLAREQGLQGSAGVRALDAASLGTKPKIAANEPISLLDYRLIEAAGGTIDAATILKQAAPSLLAALALDPGTPPDLKLAAAEGAAQVNAIKPEELARIYRARAAVAAGVPPESSNPAERRAALFAAAEAEGTPLKKVRLIRSFLDDARRSGLYLTALNMIAPASQSLVPAPEIGWYCETGIEAALAAGDYQTARRWAAFGSSLDSPGNGNLDHWLALIDIADAEPIADRTASLRYVEELAVHGRLDPTLLHRLATVLDALDYNVPIPLWQAASRTPQPSGGHLPETGVLTELQDASKKREFGRTVLLVMKTLGPNGAEGAHMIALGDSIRALKRAGLEGDARRLGFEALFASWPRSIVN
jgi:hypothetical protein